MKTVAGLFLLGLLAGANGSSCDDCASLNRASCPEGSSECGVCEAGFGPATGFSTCVCEEDTRLGCSGHGYCRSDMSCSCFPEFYGVNCDKEITRSKGFSDYGMIFSWLGMIILGPVMAGLAFLLLQVSEDGGFENCFSNCNKSRSASPSPRIGGGNVLGHGPRSEPADEGAQEQRHSEVEIQERPKGTLRNNSSQAQSQDSHGIDVEALPLTERGSENSVELVRQLCEIIPQATPAEARVALQTSNWVLAQAIPLLMAA